MSILIDSSLCREDASTGRLRFTCAHELAHWLLHKRLYSGTGESAAMMTETNIVRTQNNALEMQANLLGAILLMLAPGTHSHFESGKFSQFWPEPGTNPAQWVRLKTPFRVHPKQPN